MNSYDKKGGELMGLYIFLEVLSIAPGIIRNVKEITEEIGNFPTFPTEVMNEHVMWNTMRKSCGWEMQQNVFTQHCRIIDSHNVRRAWGTYEAMEKKFERLQNAEYYRGENLIKGGEDDEKR